MTTATNCLRFEPNVVPAIEAGFVRRQRKSSTGCFPIRRCVRQQGCSFLPFKAQAKDIASYLATNQLHSWSASTVHSQQGSEANVVIFDTVNAGSYSWPYDEWKRLVNVALSRSREGIIVLSSRAEMDEPYLRPLLRHLVPRVLKKQGKNLTWESVPAKVEYSPPNRSLMKDSNSVGGQLAKRKELRPVLSHEQERLCGLELDGNLDLFEASPEVERQWCWPTG